MSEPVNLPRIPKDRIEPSPRKLSELKLGERVILSLISHIELDKEGHVWVDVSSEFRRIPLAPELSLLAERTDGGFILWLDKQVKFRQGRRYGHREYLPVVEFREASDEED